MISRKITQHPHNHQTVKATYPIGQCISAYGGTVTGVVKGYRRTRLNGTLVIMEYTNTWEDGYSETRRMHASPNQLKVIDQLAKEQTPK